jgi:valyl-tRNA synthetase
MAVYRLFWDEFSSWYLEMVKPAYGSPMDAVTMTKTLGFFDTLLKMLHPFMPFITEELWQHLYDRKEGESIMLERLEVAAPTESDNAIISDIELVKQVVTGVRMVRNQKAIAPKAPLDLQVVQTKRYEPYREVIVKMGNLSSMEITESKAADAAQFMVGTDEFAVPLGSLIDVSAEIEKQEKDLEYQEKFLASVEKKLANERFVANAPEAVVALERKKRSDSMEKIASLRASLEELRKKL